MKTDLLSFTRWWNDQVKEHPGVKPVTRRQLKRLAFKQRRPPEMRAKGLARLKRRLRQQAIPYLMTGPVTIYYAAVGTPLTKTFEGWTKLEVLDDLSLTS